MSWTMPIEFSKVREFARAVKSKSPEHRSPDGVIPPTFLVSGRLNWEPGRESAGAGLDFDLRRVLHGEEEYVFYGELPRVGDVLTGESRVGDRWEKPGKRGGTMRFARLITEFRDAAGNVVATQNSTIVETARPPKREGE
ncbi:FAS1-like dehydratase domain-containing protein [Amycolatopsis jejuensis]|uniref:FAS1-like dehydratase domain-containing protein n=1 Tax=Amycolatopsis jejuensis TaxID=330084 RepID=UPI000526329B|nr:MaoC family dehydratase N-terminal domain-containing protein [Amycolatopsis jejuensis]